jgi:2'-5' RNA ligase
MAAGSSPDYGSPVTRPGRPQSGLIVEVPEADPVVGQHRALLDASAPLGVPAHITVLFPFMPPRRIDEQVLAELEHLFAAVTRFRFRLDDTGWFGDDVLWLAPRDPGPFRALTQRVYGAFPAFPPFEGQFDDVVPHLTIGHGRPLNDLHSAEESIQAQLPIDGHATAVTLMTQQSAAGQWTKAATFSLA